jgi:hypothetical protein
VEYWLLRRLVASSGIDLRFPSYGSAYKEPDQSYIHVNDENDRIVHKKWGKKKMKRIGSRDNIALMLGEISHRTCIYEIFIQRKNRSTRTCQPRYHLNLKMSRIASCELSQRQTRRRHLPRKVQERWRR